jgi:hypothetical protein
VTNEKRDEAECPTCRRPNDRGVESCWWCQAKDPAPLAPEPLSNDWSSALMRGMGASPALPGIYPPTQSNGLGPPQNIGISYQPISAQPIGLGSLGLTPQPVSLQIDRSEMTLLAEGLLGNAERLVNFDPAEALRLIDRAREIVEKLR